MLSLSPAQKVTAWPWRTLCGLVENIAHFLTIAIRRELVSLVYFEMIYMEPDRPVAAPLPTGAKFPEPGAQRDVDGFASALAHRLSADVFR